MSRKRSSPSAAAGPPLVPAGPIPEWVACIWLAHFTILHERVRHPNLATTPLVLVSGDDRGPGAVVRACSPEALAAGVTVGGNTQSLLQHCPGATRLPFDGPYYLRRFDQLLAALEVLSPLIAGSPLEVIHVDLTRLPHLDGSKPEEVLGAVRSIVPPVFPVRLGLASGAFTAWVAATQAPPGRPRVVLDPEKREFLREAPSTLLPVEPEVLRRLSRMGLRTLGRIAALPRSALLAQFGWPGERLHRLACGEDREPLTPYRSLAPIRETWHFPFAPAEVHFMLALGELTRRAWARKERGGRAVREVRLEARREDGAIWERGFTLRQPRERPEPALAELKRRLEGGLPPGVLTELSLELAGLAPRVEGQQLLFQEERVEREQRLKAELDQVRTRGPLRGRDAAYRIVEVDPWSRFPEGLYGLVRFDP